MGYILKIFREAVRGTYKESKSAKTKYIDIYMKQKILLLFLVLSLHFYLLYSCNASCMSIASNDYLFI